jgi:hypothetical protein
MYTDDDRLLPYDPYGKDETLDEHWGHCLPEAVLGLSIHQSNLLTLDRY